LGRMLIRLFKENGIPLVNVVRREEQVQMLKEKHGAEYVLNSTDPDFESKLLELSE
jgi:NADPH2:quinone reductase